jgi:hypothetical protein
MFGLKKTIIMDYTLLKENFTVHMCTTLKYLGYKSPSIKHIQVYLCYSIVMLDLLSGMEFTFF